jgi:hypothetical protein
LQATAFEPVIVQRFIGSNKTWGVAVCNFDSNSDPSGKTANQNG